MILIIIEALPCKAKLSKAKLIRLRPTIPAESTKVSDLEQSLDPLEPGTPYLNILEMAYFNGGQYELAIDAFERNRQRGGPDAPNMEAYRAATYAALGREGKAREVIANLNVRPGEISPENWIRRWTPSQKIAEKTIGALHRLGMKNHIGASPG